VGFLEPRFPEGSLYFTGTYSDEYGVPNGLMKVRNVHRDFRRFLGDIGFAGDFVCGVEKHQYRDVLHLHGILAPLPPRLLLASEPLGDSSGASMDAAYLKGRWGADRGYARVLPVLDGCVSYVTKYALKGDAESFDWRLR